MPMQKNRSLPAFRAVKKIATFLTSLSIIFQLVIFPDGLITGEANASQDSEDVQSIAPDKSIKRRIDPGESHLFRINLTQGQSLRVILDSRGTELEITLYETGRRKLFRARARRNWPTPLSLTPTGSGIHTLEVNSVELNEGEGYYELSIEHPGQASGQQRNLKASEKAIAEAERLRAEWKSASLLKAIGKYEEARKYVIYAGDAREQAYVLKSIADIYYTMGQNKQALQHYDQALLLIRTTRDRRLEVEALNDLASVHVDLADKDKAIEYSNEAHALSQEIDYTHGRAQALANIGACYSYRLGDKQKALEFFTQSLSLWQSLRDMRGEAQTLMHVGYAHTDLGEIKKGFSYFEHALRLWRITGDRRGEALALTAIGLAYSSLGEMQTALEYHNKAAYLLQQIGDRLGQAVTLNGMAYVFVTLGEINKALGLFNQALEIHQESGRPTGEAVALGHIADLYELQGEKQKALGYLGRKLSICRSIKNRRMESHTLRGLGAVLDSLGDKGKALDFLGQALSISESVGDPRGQAYALNNIGNIYERSGQKQKALDHYKPALALLRAADDRAGETLTMHNIARAARDIGDLKEAYNQSSELLKIIESLRTKVASQELRASYSASVRQHYELYADILMQMHKQSPSEGYDAKALEVSEKARVRSLLDLLKETRIDVRQGVDPVLLQQERDLQILLNSKAERQFALLNRGQAGEQVEAIKRDISDLTFEYEEVLAKIRSNSPRYAALTQPNVLSLYEMQQVLDKETLLLEYLLGNERSYLWAVSTDSVTSYELPGRAKIEGAARALYDSLTSFSQFPKGLSARQVRRYQEKIDANYSITADKLSRILLDPVISQLKAKRLVIVADGALQYVPFAALPDPAKREHDEGRVFPLILTHEIISLPSLSVLAVLRDETRGRDLAPRALAVLADPVYEQDDPRVNLQGLPRKKATGAKSLGIDNSRRHSGLSGPGIRRGSDERLRFQRLPSAWREATTITNLVPESERKLALGFDASVSTATGTDLRQYRIVHFATHGLLYGSHPQLYGIVLSLVDKEGRSQDGFLRLNEIYNLKLPIELVVLSACQTALGKYIKGEGLVGITRGFMYAGAPRIVASLWKVDDVASAELMKLFYEMLLHQRMRPSAALQAAQIAMWKDPRWRPPYYWAAFALQGEWK